MNKLFTTESVSEGHPDKISDTISDLVVTMHLQNDSNARVACETLVTKNTIVLAGEINTTADINNSLLNTKILDYVRYLGYDYEGSGFEPDKIIIDNKVIPSKIISLFNEFCFISFIIKGKYNKTIAII